MQASGSSGDGDISLLGHGPLRPRQACTGHAEPDARGLTVAEAVADQHRITAEVLVRQFLGNEALDGRPNSIDDTFRAKQARKTGNLETLARRVLQDEAAATIQKSYRRYRSEQSLRRSSFGKFGHEALDLIRRYKEGAGKLQEETFASRTRLVLNFDINKTIIMSDRAQDGDMDFIVNSLLAECAWGRLEPGPEWVPVGRLATDRPVNDPQLMTYRAYLDSFLLPFEVGRSAAAQQRNAQLKAKRQALKRGFTSRGSPGYMFRGVYERLRKALELPVGHKNGGRLFKDGLCHILPSFFNLLIHLQNQKRDFTIVFRTFGMDIDAVVEEMNMFCSGQHPQYPQVRMDGSDGHTDLRLHSDDSLAVYFRTSLKSEGARLLQGGCRDIILKKEISQEEFDAAAGEGQGLVLTGYKPICTHFLDIAKQHNRAFAVRDHYSFWKLRNERSNAGKLFLLDFEDKDTLKIFFDDNVGHTAPHIVDARDVNTGQPVPFKRTVGKHILKVEPLNAILDPHYFIRAVHQCVLDWIKGHQENFHIQANQNAGYRQIPFAAPDVSQELRQPVINTSRRARQLWSTLQVRVMALIRIQHALQDAE